MDLPIPVIRSPAGMDVELAAHAVDLPSQVPVFQLGDQVEATELESTQIDVADDDAAEMCDVSDVPAAIAASKVSMAMRGYRTMSERLVRRS